jgi:HlyD family secretion protein
MRRIITILIVLGLLAAGWFAFQRYRQQQSAQAISSLETVPAGRGDLTATVGATGTVRANQSAVLAWQTTGQVEAVSVAVGDAVEAGQALASLAETSLSQNVILARADLVSAQKALDDLENSAVAREQALQAVNEAQQAVYESERALAVFSEDKYENDVRVAEDRIEDEAEQLEQAQEDLEPYADRDPEDDTREYYEDLLADAQRQYDEAVRRLDLLRLQPLQAEAALELARAQLADAQRAYERVKDGPDPDEVASLEARLAAAEAALKLARLEAPFAGTVTSVDARPGDQAAPATPAFRVDDLSRLLVDVQVSEVDINRIRPGQAVLLSFDAIQGKQYHGEVTAVAQVGNVVQGVVEFTVTVELTDADDVVRPGMTAAVNIVVEQLEDVLLVPNRAVRVRDGQRVVYVLEANQPQPVEISLGATSDTVSQVVDGDLSEGDAIVLNPPVQFDGEGGPGFLW